MSRSKFSKIIILAILSIVFLVPFSAVRADTKNTIEFKTGIVDQDNLPLTDGVYNFRFSLYGQELGGNSLWSEDWNGVTVRKGQISVDLGSFVTFPSGLFKNTSLYLQICLDANAVAGDGFGECAGAYEENFKPRKVITAVPWAYRASSLGPVDIIGGQTAYDIDTYGDQGILMKLNFNDNNRFSVDTKGTVSLTDGTSSFFFSPQDNSVKLTDTSDIFFGSGKSLKNNSASTTSGASLIGLYTGDFNNNLSANDNTLQKALDTIDNLTLGGVCNTCFTQNGNAFGATAVLGTTDNNGLSIITNNVERIAINADGTVGIGTTNPVSVAGGYALTAESEALINGSLYSGIKGLVVVNNSVSPGSIKGVRGQIEYNSDQTTAASAFGFSSVVSINSGQVWQPTGYAAFVNIASGATGGVVVGSTLGIYNSGTILNSMTGYESEIHNSGTVQGDTYGFTSLYFNEPGTINGDAYGFFNRYQSAQTILGDKYGLALLDDGNDTSINNYGIYISALAGASASTYSIYSVNGDAYFGNGLHIGNTSNTTAGNMRWTGLDFEGYNGSTWISLTSGVGGGCVSCFHQNGDSFGATASLGTADNNSLEFITNNLSRFTLDTNGDGTLNGRLALWDATPATDSYLRIDNSTRTQTSGTLYPIYVTAVNDTTGGTTRGIYSVVNTGTTNNPGALRAIRGDVNYTTSGTATSAVSSLVGVTTLSAGTVPSAFGGSFNLSILNGADVTTFASGGQSYFENFATTNAQIRSFEIDSYNKAGGHLTYSANGGNAFEGLSIFSNNDAGAIVDSRQIGAYIQVANNGDVGGNEYGMFIRTDTTGHVGGDRIGLNLMGSEGGSFAIDGTEYGLYVGGVGVGSSGNTGIYIDGANGTNAYSLYSAQGQAYFTSTENGTSTDNPGIRSITNSGASNTEGYLNSFYGTVNIDSTAVTPDSVGPTSVLGVVNLNHGTVGYASGGSFNLNINGDANLSATGVASASALFAHLSNHSTTPIDNQVRGVEFDTINYTGSTMDFPSFGEVGMFLNTENQAGAFVTGSQLGGEIQAINDGDVGGNQYGLYVRTDTTGYTAGDKYGAYILNSGNTGTIDGNEYGMFIAGIGQGTTGNYGLYIDAISGAGSTYAIYSVSGDNYFGGDVNIGGVCSDSVGGSGTGPDGCDIAETFSSTQTLQPGDVVKLDLNGSWKDITQVTSSSDLAIGVISTNPTLVMGNKPFSGDGAYPVGLTGVLPTKVTDENGLIKRGDFVTPSNTAGHGMKGADGSTTIGIALEDQVNSEDVINVLISRNNGTIALTQNIIQNNTNQASSEMDSVLLGFTTQLSGLMNINDSTVTLAGIFEAEAIRTKSLAITSDKVGEATVTIGTSSVTTPVVGLKADAKVFLTPLTSIPAGYQYWVEVQDDQFIVNFNQPIVDADLKFNYLIVDSGN